MRIKDNKLIGQKILHYKIIESLLNSYPHIKIVLILGERGAIYADSLKQLEQDAFTVNPIDTTATVDTFIGYFLASICRGADPETPLSKIMLGI